MDILIHNAAMGWYGAPAEQAPASIDELLAVNVNAPIALTHMLLPHVSAVRGVVVFVSSMHSVLPTPDFAVYTATKAALDGFARNLRIELRNRVDVVVVWPGPTRTALHARSGIPAAKIKSARYVAPEVVAERIARVVTRRRFGTLRAVDGVVRWLANHFESQIDGTLAAIQRRRP